MPDPIYLTQSNVIRGLSSKQYRALKEMCRYSNNLYNVALYNIRQYFFSQDCFLTYKNNYHECKTNDNYKLLQAGVSQQILKIVDRSFKSFFSLLKKCKTGDYCYHDVNIPSYRKKDDYFNLICPVNAISISKGYFKVPMSYAFRKSHPDLGNILIPYPDRLKGSKVKEVRIIPYDNAKHFKIQYVVLWHQEPKNIKADNCMAIDIGVDNFATCVSNVETPFIIDGRKLKSINQYWNKRKAYLQSIVMKEQGMRMTHQITTLTVKRNNRVNDYIKKASRIIINNCLENHIGTLYVGYNKGFKQSVNMGKINNQNFVQMPFGKFREQLNFLCRTYGIMYKEVEESYTSKSSFLDNDPLPEYNTEQPYTGTFSGKRIKRGLYKASDGTLINADVNGAYNIMRKSKQNFCKEELSSGLLESPVRITIQ